MTHRSVELNRGPSPHLGFIGCSDGLFKLPAIRLSGRVLPGTRRSGGLPSDHHGSSNGLETFVTTQGPSRPLAIDTRHPPRAPSSLPRHVSGTQSTVLVCWATQLFLRSRHVASVTQSRVALPAARHELLEHRRQQPRPLLRVLAQPAFAVAFPLRMSLVALILRLHAHHPAALAEYP